DGIGGLLFISAAVALGLLFQDAITSILSTLTDLGKIGGLILLTAIGLYLLIKWWRRRLFIRQLRMDRITVAELRKLIEDGQEVVILDVRPQEIRAEEGTIPGAVSAHPADTDPALKTIPVRWRLSCTARAPMRHRLLLLLSILSMPDSRRYDRFSVA